MAGFVIIPVLDLKAGHVVHARAGDRARYLPIETPLAATSRPEDVLAGLLSLAPFARVYIADLDAIEGRGDHLAQIRALRERFPAVEFWLDNGCGDAARAGAVAHNGLTPVVGSESLRDVREPERLTAVLGRGGYVLSLDHRGGDFLGPPELAASPGLWPDRVVVMTLDRVGRGAGPDLAKLAAIKKAAGAREVHAAGGVRGLDDVAVLRRRGIAGALVASALHNGSLTSQQLSGIARPA